jgi:hypothetical protein
MKGEFMSEKDCPLCGEENRLYVQATVTFDVKLDEVRSANPLKANIPETIQVNAFWGHQFRKRVLKLVCGGCCRTSDENSTLKVILTNILKHSPTWDSN